MTNDMNEERLSRRRLLGSAATLGVGAAGLALVGCGDDDAQNGAVATAVGAGPTPTPSTEQPKKGGVLKVGQVADLNLNTGFPAVLLPQNRYFGYSGMESLVRYRDSLLPENVLAERFEYNADRSKLTVTLKPKVTFHNGAKVTPEDVFFGIDLMLDPKKYGVTGSFQLVTFAKFITDKKRVDERTMEFTFDKPRVNMTDFFAQLSVTHAASYEDLKVGKSVQGTGAYMFKSWTPNQGFRLEPNPNWHLTAKEGGPYLDAIEGKIFADQDAMGLAFESGDIELVMGINGTIAKRFRDKKQTRLAPKVGLAYVGCVVTNPMLKDKRVRQALFLALDRKRFAEEIGEGFSPVTVQPWPTNSPAFDKALEAPFYDPARAKDLLKQAGFTQDRPLKIEYSGTAYPIHAPVWKENFEAIGVKIELVPTEANQQTANFTARKFTDMFVAAHAFADLSPLTNFQQTFPYRIPNISYYGEPGGDTGQEYVAIIKELEGVDPASAKAKEGYSRFNKLWPNEAWLLPFQGADRIELVGDKVRGFGEYFLTLSQSPNFAKVWKKT